MRDKSEVVERVGSIDVREIVKGYGLVKVDSPILRGHRIYYDLIRQHMGLNGKIPIQEAGVKMKFNGNRWLELIKKAVEVQQKESSKDDQ